MASSRELLTSPRELLKSFRELLASSRKTFFLSSPSQICIATPVGLFGILAPFCSRRTFAANQFMALRRCCLAFCAMFYAALMPAIRLTVGKISAHGRARHKMAADSDVENEEQNQVITNVRGPVWPTSKGTHERSNMQLDARGITPPPLRSGQRLWRYRSQQQCTL